MENSNALPKFISNRKRAKWVIILLSITVFVSFIAVVSDLAEYNLITRFIQGENITNSQAEANDTRQGVIGLSQVSLFLITGISYFFWLHRASKNLRSIGSKGLRFSPGQAVGHWFIPFLNIVRPRQIVTEIWKASNRKVENDTQWKMESNPSLVSWWWNLYLLSNIISRFTVTDFDTATLQDLQRSSLVYAASDSVSLITALLAIFIIKEINRRQEIKENSQPQSVIQEL